MLKKLIFFLLRNFKRYYAILHPMRAQYLCTLSQARKVIVGTWISSFILACPILWIQVSYGFLCSTSAALDAVQLGGQSIMCLSSSWPRQVHMPVGERFPAYWCVRDWENPISWQVYELYMCLLILVMPLSIMAWAYTAICKEIWRVTYLRSAMTKYAVGGFSGRLVLMIDSFIFFNPADHQWERNVCRRRRRRHQQATQLNCLTCSSQVPTTAALHRQQLKRE